ncbi:MAG TPA: hypothetical protein DCS11_10910 [Syntrophus sp. (in: bacteria)]|nr:hypothetical protein [Syntrophus sp. (in: bacteria)]
MEPRKEFAAPCGLYCGVCGIRIAHENNDENFKERLAPIYGLTAADIRCKGCLSDDPFVLCRACRIKTCTQEKGYEGCHQCAEFPCRFIEEFPIAVGKQVILRAIPQWREQGTAAWMAAEEKRYLCPHCGYKLFRGAKRCRKCKEPVALD